VTEAKNRLDREKGSVRVPPRAPAVGASRLFEAEGEELRALNPRRVNQMDENRESQVELYKAYSVEEILERRELFGGSSSSSD
jgi:hypothetical protein